MQYTRPSELLITEGYQFNFDYSNPYQNRSHAAYSLIIPESGTQQSLSIKLLCQSEHKPHSSEDRCLGIKARDTFRQGFGKERGTNTKVEKQNTKGGNIGTMRIHLRVTESKKVRNSFSSYCDTVEMTKLHQILCCTMTTSARSPKSPIVKTKCPLLCTLWIHSVGSEST